MPIKGFKYKEFAQNLAEQAKDVVPKDILGEDRDYIINLVYNFCLMAGKALDDDPNNNLNVQQAITVCQFIGEWTFYKSVDVIRSKIDKSLRDEILQKVAFTVFEIAKLAMTKNMEMQEVIPLVEQHVKVAFEEIINELNKKGVLNEKTASNAKAQSCIDIMAQEQTKEYSSNQQNTNSQNQSSLSNQVNKRVLKLASLALLLKKMQPNKANSILKKFDKKDAGLIRRYMNMPDLQSVLDTTIALKCLKEVKNNMPQENGSDINKIVRKIRTIVKNSSEQKISAIMDNERDNIKNIVKPNTKINISPKVAAIVYRYLEEKIKA